MSATVRDNPELNRYEIRVDDQVAGFGEYKLGPGRIAFLHTRSRTSTAVGGWLAGWWPRSWPTPDAGG